ncbi:hypothetical protein T440DRAFT_520513 [Plenodomus tracheiphilus IPT5]|uniref:Peptidase metallopeptidase domain-containing protein n=1 Tax=Plenodomus tracheiphilus IPT5 TaxID=1408161 RepID=A0A6A7B0I6_9PLEO|nr:hypothetical protein T440DRAFT_520513 [Plenodomus tracheiphilus IPT5]
MIPSASGTHMTPDPSSTPIPDQRQHSKHIHDFYKLYGWLKPGTQIPDSDLPSAIRKIQRVLKEPVTGKFSDRMMSIMTGPRCGTEQPYNQTDAETPLEHHARYVLWGPKWAKTTVTWKFLSYSNDVSTAVQQATVSNAFAQWTRLVPLNIVPAATNAQADINIRFTSLGRDDTRYGYTTMVSDGTSLSSGNINVTFNDDYVWSDDRLFNFTAVHEFGHALGLSHSAVESAVMFAYFEGNIRPLHPDDKMGVHSIYGWRDPRWTRIDATPSTQNILQITSSSNTISPNDGLYQLRSTGQILRYTTNTWTTVDNNPDTVQITGASGTLYQRHKDGSTYRWTGRASAWDYIGAASTSVTDIVAGGNTLYARRADGWITVYTNTGTTWRTIDQPSAPLSRQIAITDSKTLWNLLSSGAVVRSFYPYDNDDGEWVVVDDNPTNIAIAVGGDEFYKLQTDGTLVWLNLEGYYWETIEVAGCVGVYAVGGLVYSRHGDGTVWRYTGTPMVWEMVDGRGGIGGVVGDRRGGVWEMLGRGEVWGLVE